MDIYVYEGEFKSEKLMDEFVAATGVIPYFESSDGWVKISVPEGFDKSVIDSVVDAHDAFTDSIGEIIAKRVVAARDRLLSLDKKQIDPVLADLLIVLGYSSE